jgi:hypothetical protein
MDTKRKIDLQARSDNLERGWVSKSVAFLSSVI